MNKKGQAIINALITITVLSLLVVTFTYASSNHIRNMYNYELDEYQTDENGVVVLNERDKIGTNNEYSIKLDNKDLLAIVANRICNNYLDYAYNHDQENISNYSQLSGSILYYSLFHGNTSSGDMLYGYGNGDSFDTGYWARNNPSSATSNDYIAKKIEDKFITSPLLNYDYSNLKNQSFRANILGDNKKMKIKSFTFHEPETLPTYQDDYNYWSLASYSQTNNKDLYFIIELNDGSNIYANINYTIIVDRPSVNGNYINPSYIDYPSSDLSFFDILYSDVTLEITSGTINFDTTKNYSDIEIQSITQSVFDILEVEFGELLWLIKRDLLYRKL